MEDFWPTYYIYVFIMVVEERIYDQFYPTLIWPPSFLPFHSYLLPTSLGPFLLKMTTAAIDSPRVEIVKKFSNDEIYQYHQTKKLVITTIVVTCGPNMSASQNVQYVKKG